MLPKFKQFYGST